METVTWKWPPLFGTYLIYAIEFLFPIAYATVKFGIEAEYERRFPDHPDLRNLAIAMMGAIQTMLGTVLAPVGGALTQKYTPRNVFCIFSIFPCLGLSATWFMNDILHVSNEWAVFFDILGVGISIGVSMGILFGPVMSVLQLYFEPEKRGSITGIAASGGPLSYIVLVFGVHYLAHAFSWRGVLLIVGAFSMNAIAASLTFVPIPKPDAKFTQSTLLTVLHYFDINLFKKWHFSCILLSFATGYASNSTSNLNCFFSYLLLLFKIDRFHWNSSFDWPSQIAIEQHFRFRPVDSDAPGRHWFDDWQNRIWQTLRLWSSQSIFDFVFNLPHWHSRLFRIPGSLWHPGNSPRQCWFHVFRHRLRHFQW